MFIKKLELTNFRNYRELKIECHPFLNIFIGDNAQGKTNILEAIYYISGGKSHRTSKDQELIRWNDKYFNIKIQIQRLERDIQVEIKYIEGKKNIHINGVEKKKFRELLGNLNTVLFSPEDLWLIKGGPGERRDFLDFEICQVSNRYFYWIQQYNKVLKHRNNLLKSIKEGKSERESLQIWNEQLVSYGKEIILKRYEVVKKLNLLARLMHRKITNGLENLELKYQPNIDPVSFNKEDIEKKFFNVLKINEREEIIKGTTLSGPHRDDLLFYLNESDLKSYGSQGQQRTAALALKLAELEFMKSETGEYPVLLLDDVMSELDAKRRNDLLEAIKDKIQTFITTTNLNYLQEKVTRGKIFKVNHGNIIS